MFVRIIFVCRGGWYAAIMPELEFDELTPKQMLRYLVRSNERLETAMSDLSTQISALQEAVGGVATRVQVLSDDLLADVAAAQAALDAAAAADAAEDADYEQVIADLTAALAASQAASQAGADMIAPLVEQLNAVAAPEEPPVEEPPVEEPPVEEPPVEEPPVEPWPDEPPVAPV